MKIKDYTIVDETKFKRALNGSVGRAGEMYGGVGEDASDEVKLAAYDRLGGLITHKGNKIKTGCFCDFKASRKANKPVPVEKPKPVYEFKVGSETVYTPVGKALPLEIQVDKKAKSQKKAKKSSKKKKK